MKAKDFMPQSGRIVTEDDEIKYQFDPITHNPRNTNSDHSAVHYGLAMCLHLYAASISALGKQIYRFKGPSTLYAHIKGVEVSGQGATAAVRLIRDTTANPLNITVNGSEIVGAIQNLNDNASKIAQSKIYDTNVAYTGGEIWCQKICHGSTDSSGNKNIQSGASFVQNPNIEYISKSGDVDYILEIENLDDTYPLVHLDVNMFFYEEPNGWVDKIYASV